jgi:sugar phosphate isomerase/epimerase
MNSCSRRTFLKTSSAIAATSLIGIDSLSAATLKQPVGLQLYSVRNLLPKDFQGTLDRLAQAGYKEVEAAGYFGKTAADFGNALQKAGLKCISTHHALTELKSQLTQLIEYGQALGLEYIICSWAGVHRDPSRTGELNLDDWRYVADQFNVIGQKVSAAGMTFGYHNHTIEFASENGVVFFDELLKRTDPKLVCFEMDCGWVVAGGHNPVEYLSKSPARFPLFHIKDFIKGTRRQMAQRRHGKRQHRLQTNPPRCHRPQALLHRTGRIPGRPHAGTPRRRRLHQEARFLISETFGSPIHQAHFA